MLAESGGVYKFGVVAHFGRRLLDVAELVVDILEVKGSGGDIGDLKLRDELSTSSEPPPPPPLPIATTTRRTVSSSTIKANRIVPPPGAPHFCRAACDRCSILASLCLDLDDTPPTLRLLTAEPLRVRENTRGENSSVAVAEFSVSDADRLSDSHRIKFTLAGQGAENFIVKQVSESNWRQVSIESERVSNSLPLRSPKRIL